LKAPFDLNALVVLISPRLNPVIVVALLIAFMALAGCAGGADEAGAPAEAEPTPTAETGSIRGTVTNSELLGIPGVAVAILDLELEGVTDSDGVFVFNDLEPGTYKVFAQKLGYESAAVSVPVVAGEVVDKAIELVEIVTTEPYHEIVEEVGYISCGVGTSVVTVWVNCAEVTGNHRTTIVFSVNSGLSASMSETVWESTTAASAPELLVNEAFDGELRCDRCQGASPLVLVTDDYGDVEDETELSHGYFTGFGGAGLPVAFSFDQTFTVYLSSFYHQGVPDGWSAAPA
jgi:hypothetical protein